MTWRVLGLARLASGLGKNGEVMHGQLLTIQRSSVGVRLRWVAQRWSKFSIIGWWHGMVRAWMLWS